MCHPELRAKEANGHSVIYDDGNWECVCGHKAITIFLYNHEMIERPYDTPRAFDYTWFNISKSGNRVNGTVTTCVGEDWPKFLINKQNV